MVLAEQGLGHTLSGYGSYLLKPEPADSGPPANAAQQHQPQDPAQQLDKKMDQKEAALAANTLRQNGAHSNGTAPMAPVNGQGGPERCGAAQQRPASELRSRKQLQVTESHMTWVCPPPFQRRVGCT